MNSADPFHTEELDERRARQRRQLRMVPIWLLEDAAKHPFPDVGVQPGDEALLESLLRDLVDEAADAIGAEFLGRMETAAKAGLLAEVLTVVWNESVRKPTHYPQVETLMNRYSKQASESRVSQLPDDVAGADLHRLMVFSLWADELAGDGYRDLRLST